MSAASSQYVNDCTRKVGEVLALASSSETLGVPFPARQALDLVVRLRPDGRYGSGRAELELMHRSASSGASAHLLPAPTPSSPIDLSLIGSPEGDAWGALAWELTRIQDGQEGVLGRRETREAFLRFVVAGRAFGPDDTPLGLLTVPVEGLLEWWPISPTEQKLRVALGEGWCWLDEEAGLLYDPAAAQVIVVPVGLCVLREFEALPPLSNWEVSAFNQALLSAPEHCRPPLATALPTKPVVQEVPEWEVHVSVEPTGRNRPTGSRVSVRAGVMLSGRLEPATGLKEPWRLQDDCWLDLTVSQRQLSRFQNAIRPVGFKSTNAGQWDTDFYRDDDVAPAIVSLMLLARRHLHLPKVVVSGLEPPPQWLDMDRVFEPRLVVRLGLPRGKAGRTRLESGFFAGGYRIDPSRVTALRLGDDANDPNAPEQNLAHIGDNYWIRLDREAWGRCQFAESALRQTHESQEAEVDLSRAGRDSVRKALRMFHDVVRVVGEDDEEIRDQPCEPLPSARLQACLAAKTQQITGPIAGVQMLLKPAQTCAVSWITALHAHGVGGLLADDRGFGKTVEVLAAIAHIKARRRGTLRGPFILMMEARELGHWEHHLRTVTPRLSWCRYHDSKRHRITNVGDVDVVLTTFDVFKNDSGFLLSTNPEMLVLDEAMAIQNPKSKRFEAVRVAANRTPVLTITGTPLGRNIKGLWSLMELAVPGVLGSLHSFTEGVNTLAPGGEPTDEDDPRVAEFVAKLTDRVAPFLLRRLKRDYPESFPAKVPVVQYVAPTRADAVEYQNERLAVQLAVDTLWSKRREHQSMFAVQRELARLRLHSSLPTDNRGDLSGKGEFLIELLCELIAEGHRILVFSHFKETVRALMELCQELGVRAQAYLGEPKDRDRALMAFREGQVDVLLLTPLGKAGLDIPEADTVVINDAWVDPSVVDQMMDRAHRLGSKHKVVTCYQLVANGTIEEPALEVLNRFRAISGALLDGTGGSLQPLRVTRQDIEAMLAITPDGA